MSTHSLSMPAAGQPCPACGWPDLPAIAAATLHERCGYNAVAMQPQPDGTMPVMGGGRWYRMTEGAWQSYRSLCASRSGPPSILVRA